MKVIYPEGAMSLLDLLSDCNSEHVWKKLSSGELEAFHWETDRGYINPISPRKWLKNVKVMETKDGIGRVVTFHPVEMLEKGDLRWILTGLKGGWHIENDQVIVVEKAARALFPRRDMEADQGGRPEHPARAWYAERGYLRGELTIKELQREMEKATNTRAPTENAIRNWEKKAQKPPAKT